MSVGTPETQTELRPLGPDLAVFPLALGGNVFGWTADADESFAVLDAYTAGGGNFIDSADMYSSWVPGNKGGESETIIGQWLASRGRPEGLVIATKVAAHPARRGLAPVNIRAAADDSLARLGVDAIDLYYAHHEDPATPLEETVAAFSGLVDAGKIRAIGISNHSPDLVRAWLDIAARGGYHRPVALQPKYNLMERGIEADLLPLAVEADLGVVPYSALASGFLTGKYRAGTEIEGPRAGAASAYLDARGERVLKALDGIAGRLRVKPGSVALAWLAAREGVTAPIASARTASQVPLLLDSVRISLDPSEIEELDAVSLPRAE